MLCLRAACLRTCRLLSAPAISRVSGMPEFPFAVIAHPIANNDDTTLRTKAAEAVRQCEAILLRFQ